MATQPQIDGGTLSPEGAPTSGGAPAVDPLSVSTVPVVSSTGVRWWRYPATADATINFDAMLSYNAAGGRTGLDPAITVSVYAAGDLSTPLISSASGIDPQQGAVARGSAPVTVEAGHTYYIALSGGPDAYRVLRTSAARPVGPWQLPPDAEYVQVIAPEGMTIEPENWTGSYLDVVGRSRKTIEYGITPPFFGPPVWMFAIWDCMWQYHLDPCYFEVDGQLWNNPVTDIEWTGSGTCKAAASPGPTSTAADFASPAISWSNTTDAVPGHAFGAHTGSGYRIDNAALTADDPGPAGLGEFPTPPLGAVIEIENPDDHAVLTLEIAATDDGTGTGQAAFRRFNGTYGMDASGGWWLGGKPDGELLIYGYASGVLDWEPYTLDEAPTSQVVGFTQYVEDTTTPPGGAGDSYNAQSMEPELAFRLTWSPHRYRFIYPPVVPPVGGIVPVRKTPRKDQYGYESAARTLATIPAERHIAGDWD